MDQITQEEKIDYIYKTLKRQRRYEWARFTWKILLYAAVIGYGFYFYYIGFAKLKAEIIEWLKPDISSESIINWLRDSSWSLLDKAKSLYMNQAKSENNDIKSNY